MISAGAKGAGLTMAALAVALAAACGDPPESDFYAPAQKSGTAAGGSPQVATIGSTTSSVTNNSTSAGETSNTSSTVSTGAGGSGGVTTSSDGGATTSSDGGSSTGGTSTASCEGLPTWEGGNPEFTVSAGQEIQHNGHRYRANEEITYPNPECAPDAPVPWCAGWFEDLGPC